MNTLIEGEDYYLEGGLLVFTAEYHLKRGYCCNSGCRHCPFPTDSPSKVAPYRQDAKEPRRKETCCSSGSGLNGK